ncbi:MAG: SAM-dependent methyltransferase [Kiritimatiellia bacterium]|jgi:SAM-dependent methyltransferase
MMKPMMTAPTSAEMETVPCYFCGATESTPFMTAQEDLTGKPGDFYFVRCSNCSMVYQNPRVRVEKIIDYYDDDYIAHRKQSSWGMLTPLFNRAMGKLDRDKDRLVSAYVRLGPEQHVLDVGCGAGTFLERLRAQYGCKASGVDFKDLSSLPSFEQVELHCGLYYELDPPENAYDLITMWHFLEHDYDPMRSLETAHKQLAPNGRLVIEVPRLDSRTFTLFKNRWPGLQAPQHTVIFDRKMLEQSLAKTGWEIEAYLPYGAFPAYFYLFAGLAFKLRKGKGINLQKAMLPYFLGQVLLWPVLLFERRLNLSMQTVVCRKRGEITDG